MKKKVKVISFLLFCSLIVGFGFLFAAPKKSESVGKVIVVEGKAEASNRNLARGAAIFISDIIKVAQDSKIQIKFTDGGLLNLIALTEYKIDSYAFKKDGKNEFAAELLKGGFRQLSGSIAKVNRDGFKIKTPVATIGIRGTRFEANIVDGETFFGVDAGSIVVSNDAGMRELDPGEFVSAISFDQLGAISDVRPEALEIDLFVAPEGAESFDEAEEEIEAEDIEEDVEDIDEDEEELDEDEEELDEDEEDLEEDEGDREEDEEEIGEDEEDIGEEEEDLSEEIEEDIGPDELEEDFLGEDIEPDELGEDALGEDIGPDELGEDALGEDLGEGIGEEITPGELDSGEFGDAFGEEAFEDEGFDTDLNDQEFEIPIDMGNPAC